MLYVLFRNQGGFVLTFTVLESEFIKTKHLVCKTTLKYYSMPLESEYRCVEKKKKKKPLAVSLRNYF